jgi:triacylglycerol lipase
MNLKKLAAVAASALISLGVLTQPAVAEEATKTKYPVILAHGMAGWDSLLGIDYFGDEWGTFALDGCSLLEINGCNDWVPGDQKAEAFQVTSFGTSELRGTQLADQVESYMAAQGAQYINLVGHSQGGFDIRKAAHVLKARKGYVVVKDLISLSSPHRGSPYAKKIMDKYARNGDQLCWNLPWDGNPANDPCGVLVANIADALYDVLNTALGQTERNNLIAGGLQLIYDDYDPADGKITGSKAFNQNYNLTGAGGSAVAGRISSLITAQDDGNLMPLLSGLGVLIGFNGDGDGYCVNDCDNDGAAGAGDGSTYDMDDDGLVGINSQQIGTRLSYTEDDWKCAWYGCWNPLDTLAAVSTTGYVADVNNPSSTQMTSHTGKISQDHLDVTGLGPDTFDEMEFYAAISHFIAAGGN